VVLEDLQQPPQQQFEELKVSDPRRYFSSSTPGPGARTHQQQQQQQKRSLQPPSKQEQQQQGKRVKAEGLGGVTYGGKDVLELLGSVDPLQLDNPPILPSVAQQVCMDWERRGGRARWELSQAGEP
jgi:hypothetical protein